MNKLLLTSALVAFGISGCASTVTEDGGSAATQKMYTEAEKDAMTREEKVSVYNAGNSDDQQMVCRKEVVTGTHRKRRVCRTVAQRRADSESAHEALGRMQQGATGGGN